MAMEIPDVLFGTYAEVTSAVRRLYAALKRGQELTLACGPLVPINTHPGHVVVIGPDRLGREQRLFRPHLLHDVASARTGTRELQTWIVDPLLHVKWGGLCLVSQETKGICKDKNRSLALLAWTLRWFDDLEALGPIFGDDRPFPGAPTFCRAPTTLPMVVASAGVSLNEIQHAAFSGSSEMRNLIARAHANLSNEVGQG